MRPCRQCRAPIENSFVLCPHCRATQHGGTPKANPAPEPPPPSFARQSGSIGFGLLKLLAYQIVPLPVLGGLIGHSVGGQPGLFAGVATGFTLTWLVWIFANPGG
jgi:hypothetical protein